MVLQKIIIYFLLTLMSFGYTDNGVLDKTENNKHKLQKIVDSLKIEYASIPSGSFYIGDYSVDVSVHKVTLSSFKISKYEVTNNQFCIFLNTNKIGVDGVYQGAQTYKSCILITSSYGNYNWGVSWNDDENIWKPVLGYEDHPIINVTWFGAYKFCQWIGGRLPTESEWEYACRAGTTTIYNTGNSITLSKANIFKDSNNSDEKCLMRTARVGSYNPNAWGLYDMHGNVAEWCSDWYDVYSEGEKINPTGPKNGLKRVLRGGSWNFNSLHAFSARRGRNVPNNNDGSYHGFRVVLTKE